MSESDVYRRQILRTEVDSRAVRASLKTRAALTFFSAGVWWALAALMAQHHISTAVSVLAFSLICHCIRVYTSLLL